MGSCIKPLKLKVKKGQDFLPFFFVIIILLGFALFFVVLSKVWTSVKPELNTGLQSAMPANSPVNITETLDKTGSTIFTFDKLIPFIIIGLFAFVLITAGMVMNHPIMIVVGIIVFGVAILIAVIYANIYNNITESDEFSSTKAQFGIQDKFMQYLPFIIFIMGIGITAAIIWSRKGGGGSI